MNEFGIGVLTLLSALGGVVVGGLLEARRQRKAFEREKDWERSQLRHQKLELIATTANEVSSSMERVFSHLVKSLGVITSDRISDEKIRMAMQELKLAEKELINSRTPYMRTLIAFYAPELFGHMKTIWTAQGDLQKSVSEVFAGKTPEERRQALADYKGHLLAAEGACRELVEGAANLVRNELGLNRFSI